jgi:hypothetical protein
MTAAGDRGAARPRVTAVLRAKAQVAMAAIGLALVLLAVVVLDARARRARRAADQARIDAVARVLPSNGLALSGGARWLRAPAVEEPAAAFADAPALPDPDPAGGLMAPPKALWAEEVSHEEAMRGTDARGSGR